MPRTQARSRHKKRSPSLVVCALITFVGFCLINIYLVAHLDDNVGSNPVSSSFSGNDNTSAFSIPTPIQNNATVLEYFRQAGVDLDDESLQQLPTWSQIESLIGDKPVILGLERCNDFRNNVPPLRRMLGSSGMFNSGTNLVSGNEGAVTRLMKENCVIPERFNKWGPHGTKEQYGIRWQCPWGKHTPVEFKHAHTAPKNENITRDDCLPVVTVRNPFDWMKSMCNHPYTAKWSMYEPGTRGKICPHLVHRNSTPVELNAKLAEQWLPFDSLAHLWNEWYAEYWRDANFPFLMVRFEDLIFRQHDTTKIICNCAGGVVNPKNMFKYIVNSAKQGPGHGKDRTGMIEAWTKYGKPKEVKAGFSDIDWKASLEFLSATLIEKMDYKYPPSESEINKS
ncbi:hypothetical protein ACHAXR_006252 [Thalassiosira sp. AJA248-18]